MTLWHLFAVIGIVDLAWYLACFISDDDGSGGPWLCDGCGMPPRRCRCRTA